MDPHRQRHDPSKNLVGFVVGDVHYAVPIARVRAIVNPLYLVALPHAPAAVCGVADYRGDVVPVVDLRARFGLPRATATRRTKWIVLLVEDRLVALVVDDNPEVFGAGATEMRPAPAVGTGDDVRGISAVLNHSGTLVFILDTERFRELTEPLVVSGAIPRTTPSLMPKAPS